MIWTPDVYKEIRRLVYTCRKLITEEELLSVGEAAVTEAYTGDVRRAFIRGCATRFLARIMPGDVQTDIRQLPDDDCLSGQNVSRYEFRARWFPATSEVLFREGPLDGKQYAITPGLIGEPIYALQAPVAPWFARPGDDTQRVVPDQIAYHPYSWDDELNCWVYR